MKLILALLAEAATATSDGKFSVLGGDIGIIWVPTFPSTQTVLALVIKVQGSKEEEGSEHLLKVDVQAPDGETVISHVESSVILSSVSLPTLKPEVVLAPGAGLVVTMLGLPLLDPGKYTVVIRSDDMEIGSVPFYVAQRPTESDIDHQASNPG